MNRVHNSAARKTVTGLLMASAMALAATGTMAATSTTTSTSVTTTVKSTTAKPATVKKKTTKTAAATTTTSVATTTTAAGGDTANGETIFKARCAACHTITPDGNPGFTGPNLFKVVGRKSGTGMGFPYSDPMKSAGIVWDHDKLKAYIAAPSAVVPGGKMAFVGPTDPTDQDDLIAYLTSLK